MAAETTIVMPSWLLPLIGTLLVVLIGIVGKLAADVAGIKGERAVTCKMHGQALDDLPEIKRQVDRLTYRMESQDSHAADMLHHPRSRERDELIRGMLAGTLCMGELERVVELLREAKLNERKADDRLNASLLLGRAEWEIIQERHRRAVEARLSEVVLPKEHHHWRSRGTSS